MEEVQVEQDLALLARRLSAAEAAVHDAQRHDVIIRELDRLAEHLIGQAGPETQHLKIRIQRLIAVIAQNRTGVTVYLRVYCHVSEV